MSNHITNLIVSVCLSSVAASSLTAEVPSKNPMVFGDTRLSIITPTLFRLEYAHDGAFIDDPTLFAYDRTSMLPMDSITVTETTPDIFEIKTSALRMVYHNDGYPFSTANFSAYYTLNGKEKKFTNRFITKNNLGGTVETLDRVTGEIPMDDGLLSRDGWYMIDDERADLLTDGWIKPRDTKQHVQDMYCFVYGNDYKAALASLGALSGRVPMTRKHIHGVWHCRYWDYTSDEFLNIVNEYAENDFPIDNLVMDMGWHTNDATEGLGHNGHLNWTGYTWNEELIPDPKALIDSLHALGVTVSLNDHPHDGLRPHEKYYPQFRDDLGFTDADKVLFDLSDSTYMTKFFKWAHGPSEEMGVDFWWLDWQQNYLFPKVRGHESTTLSWLNELYYRDSQKGNRRGAGYSRWAGWGDHRHPIQFSGDAQANWDMLAFEVKLTACSGQGGCYYWAHDIGGFRGDPNPELTTRWTQFGALSAALRVHSTKDARLDRRPWISGEKETKAMRRFYHLRSQLMPYIYSSVWQTHNTMIPLNRSMFIEYGSQPESYNQPQEYMFGDLLLAAPITTPGEGADFVASQRVWFPAGETWYDYFTHEKKQGGETEQIAKSLDEMPLYVKGGWILPLQPYTARPATTPLNTLVMRVYPADKDVDNCYSLYEDDGISLDYEKGIYATTALQYKQHGDKVTITVHPTEGSYPDMVTQRGYIIELPLLKPDTEVKVNGKKTPVTYDPENRLYIINIEPRKITDKTTVEFKL